LERRRQFLPEPPKLVSTVSGYAVIIMVGTTPGDEDEIAIELARDGLQVTPGATVRGGHESKGPGAAELDDNPTTLADRLLAVVGRRLRGSLHATSLTIGQPDTSAGVDDATQQPVLRFGRLTIDFNRRELLLDGQEIALSKSEFGLLHFLAAQAGRVMSRRDLVLHGKGSGHSVTERSIDVHVAAIRRKLGTARFHLQTVRGVGYRFNATPRAFQADPIREPWQPLP
jgi:DNA-binding winged helix-turn-helix (wHTH) protein